MYKVYIYNVEEHKEIGIFKISALCDLHALKCVNYNFAKDKPDPVLVTISNQFNDKEIVMRSFLCYNPSKNFYRKVYNVFAIHTVDLYISNIFD